MAAQVNTEECIGCSACVDACPISAIELNDGVATVNEDECIDCGTCTEECPTGAITVD